MNRSYTLTIGLLILTVVSGGVLASSYVSADDVVDDISITVPTSCTMSGSGTNTHSAEVANGTYRADIGTTTINVLCNDYAGFSIYTTGFTGETIGQTNSNKLVGTSASGGATIDTGTATSAGNPDVSNWAMKLATNSQATYPITLTTGYDAYHAVPNEYIKVATRQQGTDVGQSATGSSLTTTYAAYISKTQVADTYSGKVKYTLVHPNLAPAPTPPPTPPTSCTTPVPNLTYMQDLNSSNKASVLISMTEEAQYYLADKRDNKSYCVAKLKDGNIWMTQSLDLDIVTDGSIVYDSTTTDLPNNTTWVPSTATYATGATTWNASDTTPESYDPGALYWNGTAGYYSSESACTAAGGTWNNIERSCNQISSTGNSHNHLGNYYNWTAAIAMNDSSSYVTDYQDANQSICPANWMLPKGGNITSNGSYRYLVGLYNYDPEGEDEGYSYGYMTNPYPYNDPLYFTLVGIWQGSLRSVGDGALFWTSVVYNSEDSYYYDSDENGQIDANYFNYRHRGFNLRCLAR